jgi:hypothetical protein
VELPPVTLYKLGDDYFVQDGHHRVSVYRFHGVEWLDAEVTEFRVPNGGWPRWPADTVRSLVTQALRRPNRENSGGGQDDVPSSSSESCRSAAPGIRETDLGPRGRGIL